MRPGQNNSNNYKNRNRNRNRRHSSGGGGGGGGNPNSRVLDSNGPDVKLRGTAQTIAEKYMQMARDAHSSGDRVMAEAYYQHADHYYRLWLAAQPAGQPIQFSRRTEEDMEDGEGGETDEDGTPEGGNGEQQEGSDGNAPALEGDGQHGEDDSQNRNFRPRENRGETRDFNSNQNNNRDSNAGGRFGRNRWPRRNDRNAENRDGNGPAVEGSGQAAGEAPPPVEQAERQERPERQERAPRRERVESAAAPEDRGDWEAPSFLKRPVPVVDDGEAEVAVVSERKPRARRPRYGEEGVTPNEPPTSEE
jgi:Domain of unknown function (DUF4167)